MISLYQAQISNTKVIYEKNNKNKLNFNEAPESKEKIPEIESQNQMTFETIENKQQPENFELKFPKKNFQERNLKRANTMQIDKKKPISQIIIKKSQSKFSPSQKTSIKNTSFNSPKTPLKEPNEIESPSKLVEKIYVNMGDTQEQEQIPKKKEFSLTRRNEDKIISKNSVPGKKDLYLSSKYSHLKKSFIKEYFYPKEDDESEKNELKENSKFENVIFNDLSATALASHKWRRKTAQNNAYLMKSFSPEFIDYPNSPKFSQYDAYIRNFNRVERTNRHCLSKHVRNDNKFDKRFFEVERPTIEYLRNFSKNERKTQMIFGMNYQEYEDVINLWKIDHLKGEIPDIRQAYDYMKIIKNSTQKKNQNKTNFRIEEKTTF